MPAPHEPLDPVVSKKLRALSLLGIAMVVVGHAPSYRDASAPSERSFWYSFFERLATDALPRVVVMMFFAVAGFLFFFGHDGSASTHLRKIASRTRSLVVPYLFWSALGLATYFALQSLPWTEAWFANSARRVVDKSAADLAVVWLFDPIPYQLWFLRDLWLMALLSPFLRWLLVRTGPLALLALAVPHLLDLGVPGPGVSRLMTGDAYFWFAVGAYVAIRGVPLRTDGSRASIWALALAIVACGRAWLLAGSTWRVDAPLASTPDLLWFKSVHLVGVPALWVLYDRWLVWMERPFFLRVSQYAFFVFAAHEPLMTTIKKPLVRALGTGDLAHAAEFAITLVVTLSLVLGAGALLRRVSPGAFQFVCGGRGA